MDDYDAVVYPGCDKPTALLEAIEVVSQLRSQLTEELHLLVWEAHLAGVTWSQIAKPLGCSRQAAHQRFGNGLSPAQIARLEDQLAKARAHAQLELDLGDDEAFATALQFLEQQEELDGG